MTQPEKITAIADALRTEGLAPEKITNAMIRDRLGVGSFSTIAPVLRDWKARLAPAPTFTAPQLPPALREMVERNVTALWQAAVGHTRELVTAAERGAQERATAEQNDLLAGIKEWEAEFEALKTAKKALEAEVHALKEEKVQINADLATHAERSRLLQEQVDELKAALKEREQEYRAASAEASELRGSLKSLQKQ